MSAFLDQTLGVIRAHRNDIEHRFGIRLLGVVGSVARGEESAQSDVDITYEVTGRPSLFTLVRAQDALAALIGREVDLVDTRTMRPRARAYIERDLVLA